MSNRSGGIAAGLISVYYESNKGKKFRSRVEACISLGILPYAKTIKTMSRHALFLLAREQRERHLISQQMSMAQKVVDRIEFFDDQRFVLHSPHNEPVDSNGTF